jgi:hypothetical protein
VEDLFQRCFLDLHGRAGAEERQPVATAAVSQRILDKLGETGSFILALSGLFSCFVSPVTRNATSFELSTASF